jgi:hypothetical protein
MSWRDASFNPDLADKSNPEILRHTLMTVVEPIFNSKQMPMGSQWGLEYYYKRLYATLV